MWVIVMFDMPTETKADRKRYAKFRKQILDDGFNMFQFSMYIRHCMSRENADVHVQRVKKYCRKKGILALCALPISSLDKWKYLMGRK